MLSTRARKDVKEEDIKVLLFSKNRVEVLSIKFWNIHSRLSMHPARGGCAYSRSTAVIFYQQTLHLDSRTLKD